MGRFLLFHMANPFGHMVQSRTLSSTLVPLLRYIKRMSALLKKLAKLTCLDLIFFYVPVSMFAIFNATK